MKAHLQVIRQIYGFKALNRQFFHLIGSGVHGQVLVYLIFPPLKHVSIIFFEKQTSRWTRGFVEHVLLAIP